MITTTYKAAPDIDVLTSIHPILGLGSIPINAFVFHGSEPLLVETGAIVDREEFMAALRSVIDPADLRWIWLSHNDPDHIGAVHQLIDENARDQGDHDLPRCRCHEPVRTASHGSRVPPEPGADARGGRSDADGGQATHVRQSVHDRVLRRGVRSALQL